MFICLSCLVNLLGINYKISYPNISLTVLLFLCFFVFCLLSHVPPSRCACFLEHCASCPQLSTTRQRGRGSRGEDPGRSCAPDERSALLPSDVSCACQTCSTISSGPGGGCWQGINFLCRETVPRWIRDRTESINQPARYVLNIYLTGSLCWTMFLTALS